MFLNVLERLLLLQLLPESGNLTTITIVRQLRESLSFNEDEHEVLQFRTLENNNMQWRTPDDWENFTRYELDDGAVQWKMLDDTFTFNGEWGDDAKKAKYVARCQELVIDGVDIKLGKKARQEVKEWLKKLDEEDQVREAHYSLFTKLNLVDDLTDEN